MSAGNKMKYGGIWHHPQRTDYCSPQIALTVLGLSGRAMLEAIVAGDSRPEVMAALA